VLRGLLRAAGEAPSNAPFPSGGLTASYEPPNPSVLSKSAWHTQRLNFCFGIEAAVLCEVEGEF
jgi:hypothetical protein